MNRPIDLVVAVTGASGAIYAQELIYKLTAISEQIEKITLIFSNNAKQIWIEELGESSFNNIPFTIEQNNNFYVSSASGSSKFSVFIVCPCSMGTLGRIAHGISNDLITRTADVALKERRKLILVTRETPLNLIHIENMRTITLAGGIICPASPSFYSKPSDIKSLTHTVIDRILQLSGFEVNTFRW